MDAKQIEREMLQWLETIVNIDSGSYYKEGIDQIGQLFLNAYTELGFSVEVIPQEKYGNHLRIRDKGATEPTILLAAHMDTVFEKGTVEKRPFSIKDGRAFGPGVIDMKASLVSILYACKLLKKESPEVCQQIEILMTSDEEIASPTSKPLIEQFANGKKYALVMEPARKDGSLVTERRGNGRFTLIVKGKAAHSGIEPEKGRSAIEELAHKIVKLHELNDHQEGISVNVGLIEGGEAVNTVSPEAIGYIDVRVSTEEQATYIQEKIEDICSTSDVEGTKLELLGNMKRPPMVKDDGTKKLLNVIKEVGESLGITITDTSTGGGSDASYTAAAGIATIDGMGPVGGNPHSEKEYLELSSLLERTILLTKVIERLAKEN